MKKNIKIIVNLIGMIIVVILILAIIKQLTKSSQTKEMNIDVQKGTFEYMPSFEESSVEDVYYYSDNYFQNSGKEENEHLRTMSLCLALSTITAVDKENQAENVENLLEDIGFYDISVEDIEEETSKDTIGTAIAHKKIKEKEMIVVSIRGANYEVEWASNFLAGKDGDIAGFSNAADVVVARIKEYKTKYDLNPCQYWIVGYSRGGAVANLLGKHINEALEDFDTSEDDLYIYTFEAPLSSTSPKTYSNIHNVINPNDLIVYVYPKKWGLRNNGVEEIIQTENKKIVKNQIEMIDGLQMIDVTDEKDNLEYINQQEYLEDFVNWLTKNSKILDYSITREKYVTLLEQPITNMIEIYMSKTKTERKEIVDFFREVCITLSKEENRQELMETLPDISSMNFSFDEEAMKTIIDKNIEIVYNNSKVPLSREELEMIKTDIFSIIPVSIPILVVSVFDGDTELEIGNIQICGFYHLATFVNHFSEIALNHYIQTNLNLVQNMDSYYQ